ncbi:MAG: hypothetical protein AB7Q97_01860 [Gammaproteobacteria bacterium]
MPTLDFDRASHTYRLDGAVIPNVTRILEVLATYQGIPASVLQAAADRGDAVHFATELWDREELDEASVPAEIAGYLNGWKKFRHESGFHPTYIEERVYSLRYRFAGTADRGGTFDSLPWIRPGSPALIDIKATAELMPVVGPQTALYALAWSESHPSGWKHLRRYAVQLRRDGDYRLHECTDPSDLGVGLSCVTIANWRARHAEQERA